MNVARPAAGIDRAVTVVAGTARSKPRRLPCGRAPPLEARDYDAVAHYASDDRNKL